MTIVSFRGHESIDEIIKLFKRKCERSGLFSEIKKRKFFVKPSELRRKKKLTARKKLLKKLRKEQMRIKRYQ